jgi:cysteinyl-tRNA synthetase
LNIPQALAVLWEVLRDNSISQQEKLSFISDSDKVFGLDLLKECSPIILEDEIMEKIREREEARKAKDFKKSDEIRKELLEKGIVLEDSSKGTVWKKA